jgi:hypothetical protein
VITVLAPDWTLSNLLLWASAFKGGFHITKPNTMFFSSVEGWAARQSLAKTAATFFGALQAVNYAFTGHTTFQNPESLVLDSTAVEDQRRAQPVCRLDSA